MTPVPSPLFLQINDIKNCSVNMGRFIGDDSVLKDFPLTSSRVFLHDARNVSGPPAEFWASKAATAWSLHALGYVDTWVKVRRLRRRKRIDSHFYLVAC